MIDVEIDSTALVCPECGEQNLHQTHIEIYARSEDAKTGNLVAVDLTHGGTAVIQGSPEVDTPRNPSARRHGLRIFFMCEHCSADEHGEPISNSLCIEQHKGTTYVYWDDKVQLEAGETDDSAS